jgi:hypothetical protein
VRASILGNRIVTPGIILFRRGPAFPAKNEKTIKNASWQITTTGGQCREE